MLSFVVVLEGLSTVPGIMVGDNYINTQGNLSVWRIVPEFSRRFVLTQLQRFSHSGLE